MMTPDLLPPLARVCIDAAAKQKGLRAADILGPTRRQDVADARHVAVALLVRHAGYSQVKAAALVNRDRTTAIASLDTVDGRGDLGAAFVALVTYIGPLKGDTKPGVCSRCLRTLRNCTCLADRGLV